MTEGDHMAGGPYDGVPVRVKRNMEKHVTLVAALNIGMAALGVIIAIALFVFVVGGGIISGDPEAMAITSIVGTAIGGFLIIISAPAIIAGIGLLRHKGWARILMMIVAALNLPNIPMGTALGVYTLWVLLQDETSELFSKRAEVVAE